MVSRHGYPLSSTICALTKAKDEPGRQFFFLGGKENWEQFRPLHEIKKPTFFSRKTTCIYFQITSLLQCVSTLREIPEMKTHSWKGFDFSRNAIHVKVKGSHNNLSHRFHFGISYFFHFLWHACINSTAVPNMYNFDFFSVSQVCMLLTLLTVLGMFSFYLKFT